MLGRKLAWSLGPSGEAAESWLCVSSGFLPAGLSWNDPLALPKVRAYGLFSCAIRENLRLEPSKLFRSLRIC